MEKKLERERQKGKDRENKESMMETELEQASEEREGPHDDDLEPLFSSKQTDSSLVEAARLLQHDGDSSSFSPSFPEANTRVPNTRGGAGNERCAYLHYRLCLLLLCLVVSLICTRLYIHFEWGPQDVGSLELIAVGSFVVAMTVVLIVHLLLLTCHMDACQTRYKHLVHKLSSSSLTSGRRNSNSWCNGESIEERVAFVNESCRAYMKGDLRQLPSAVLGAFLSIDDCVHFARLKLECDKTLRQDGLSLYWLVFKLWTLESRNAFLQHNRDLIASEDRRVARVFVISDMDDTLVSTFKDRRFPWNTLYPGVRQFYHELIRMCPFVQNSFVSRYNDWSEAKVQVTFVTARPRWLHIWTKNELIRHGFETSVALTGSSTSFITPAMMLARKVKQCTQMKELFPEGVFYLVGDNGQKDIDLGKELLQRKLVRGVFIHDIFEPLSYGSPLLVHQNNPAQSESQPTNKRIWVDQPLHRLNAVASLQVRGLMLQEEVNDVDDIGEAHHESIRNSLEHKTREDESSYTVNILPSVPHGYRKEECDSHNIILFQSFAGAAFAASQRGYYGDGIQGLLNVATAAAEDFSKIPFGTEKTRQKQRDVFLRDVARIAHSLGDVKSRVQFLKTIHSHLE